MVRFIHYLLSFLFSIIIIFIIFLLLLILSIILFWQLRIIKIIFTMFTILFSCVLASQKAPPTLLEFFLYFFLLIFS